MSSPFPVSGGTCAPWLVVPPSISKAGRSVFQSLPLISAPLPHFLTLSHGLTRRSRVVSLSQTLNSVTSA